jgi:hypothetical protein
MGVCIGACAKVEKLSPDMNASEKKQIEQNLKSNGFESENCNYKTV